MKNNKVSSSKGIIMNKKVLKDLENLYKRMDTTSKTRFAASRRLNWHSKLSTYSIVGISMFLIFISLMQAYQIGSNINDKKILLIQVFSSIIVLVYSLIIEKNDYSNLSDKLYSCASKIGKLKQEIFPYVVFKSKDEHKEITYDKTELLKIYNEYTKKYYEILDLYETHSKNDFRADYKIAKLQMSDNFPLSNCERKGYIYSIGIQYIINFITYILIVISFVIFFYWVW